jgi:hypothetical protein
MATFLEICIWKKGTNKQTSMPDYQIEISEGDLHKVSDAISALMKISDALNERISKMGEENAMFECEMEIAEITRKHTEKNGKITEEEEIRLRGTDCILGLIRYSKALSQFNDGELVKVVITGSK